MYLTQIGLMFATNIIGIIFVANITVFCPYPCLVSSTSFGDTMHLVGNNSSMKLIPLWSVGKFIFLHDLYVGHKHYFPPLLPVFVMKCCVKIHLFTS